MVETSNAGENMKSACGNRPLPVAKGILTAIYCALHACQMM